MSSASTPLAKFGAVCRMIKIEHSVFALPFAYLGQFIAAGGFPSLKPFLLLTVAMVAVRSVAMAFNRVIDLPFDAKNPRTQQRPLVTGEISPAQTWAFIAIMVAIFVVACFFINELSFMLSPVALFVAAFYSLLKRFTWLCHFWLGAVLALSPLAGWISVDPQFTVPAVLFAWGILFWVAGFDIIYSCQDAEYDRSVGLNSVPAHFGLESALVISSFCHVVTSIMFLMGGWAAGLAWPYFAVWAVVSGILYWEHTIISADDMSRVNMAFFTMNGFISVMLFAGALAGIFI
ncbi:4-hydroxybenzoate octaprenyltransferase [Halodesulfovibrio marinisediminis]|uniref:4-hydroxybenzoate polyprenyltransferase n=1 Tax=Halodesulfovibrio marinisediminis DSM 17456 TaxID=1121457 RepID=A0A1N6II22_9BACT|nr:4-hydroxybenzoate octaprenyltransferase [Halodesulfovibrio marinisediminis]SIO31690.1 4-hydroxybenzoate polyprenyltransferase [Halodesulfovibrio marinisediminis DSM 17456]